MTDALSPRRRLLAMAATVGVVLALAGPVVVLWLATDSTAEITDAEVLGTNRLGAAEIDIAISSPGGITTDGAILSARDLAPGDTVSGQLAVSNDGDIPVAYRLSLETEPHPLLAWLSLETWLSEQTCGPDHEDRRSAAELDDGAEASEDEPAGTLAPGERVNVCIGAVLALESPNEVQGQVLEFTVLVIAEQLVEGGAGSGS